MSETVDDTIREYARRYSAHDAEGVTELCMAPFLAIRGGVPIHLVERDDVRAHFQAMIDAYREAGAATWSPIKIETSQLGEHACFATVRWNALDTSGEVLRDTSTTYHALRGDKGWRFLSYTNHF